MFKYSHFQTPNSATASDHQNAILASVLTSNLASMLAIGPNASNLLMPSKYATQTSHISASTLKVLKGSALRGGYCHEPEYLWCSLPRGNKLCTTITAPSILDLS